MKALYALTLLTFLSLTFSDEPTFERKLELLQIEEKRQLEIRARLINDPQYFLPQNEPQPTPSVF